MIRNGIEKISLYLRVDCNDLRRQIKNYNNEII